MIRLTGSNERPGVLVLWLQSLVHRWRGWWQAQRRARGWRRQTPPAHRVAVVVLWLHRRRLPMPLLRLVANVMFETMLYDSRTRRRLRHYRHLWHRLGLALRPWPVYVAFHGFCCDTGACSWSFRYRTGWAAWRATTTEALHDASDGPTGYSVLSRAEWRTFENTVQWMPRYNHRRRWQHGW